MNTLKKITTFFLLFICLGLFAQQVTAQTITGTVLDVNGESVIGATVVVKGTSKGTITDIDGNFTINAAPNERLIISYIGYDTQEIDVRSNTVHLNITLKEKDKTLDEVVVIGYGSVKKSNLTTSVSKIGSEALQERPLTTLSEAFSGQLAGVQTQVSSGVPGEELQITIRGNSSLSSSSPPLYVIDGVISETMSSVNPGDVASIQVLKDAAATSIYGARGSNGVILIETKQAKKGVPTVTFDSYYGLQQPDRLPEVMSPTEWFAYNIWWINANYLNKGGSNSMDIPNKLRGTGDQIPSSWLLNPDSDTPDWRLNPDLPQTDWLDAILRVSPVQSYQLSASGSGDMGNIYFSGSYFSQEGIVKHTGYERINLRVNGTLNVGKRIRLGASIAPSVSNQRRGESEGKDKVILTALQYPPLMSMDSGTHELGFDPLYPNNVNPYIRLQSVTDKMGINRFDASAWVELDLYKGLTFKSIYNNNSRTSVYEYFVPENVVAPNAAGGVVSSGTSYTDVYNTWGIQNILNYDTRFFEKHEVGLMLGQSADQVTTYRANLAAQDFPLENVPTLNMGVTPTDASTRRNIIRTASFFGRLSYNYGDRYLATASLRYDGSTRFGSGNRWGVFPAFSAGWKISSENFMKSLNFLSLMKLRASWGLAGNDRIGDFEYLSKFEVTQAVYGGQAQAGMYPKNFANPDLQWESTESLDFGVDLSFLKNRLQLNFDYYINTTKDLLYDLRIPATTGFTSMKTNIATIENRGWELDLTSYNIDRKDFKWSTTLNLSKYKNTVIDAGGNDGYIHTSWYTDFILKEGHPVSQFYIYRTDGLLTADDFGVGADGRYDRTQPLVPVMANQIPGNVKFVDANKDGVINEDDRVPYGSNIPDLLYGLKNTFSYKGFDLSIFLQGQFGGDVLYLASRNIGVGRRHNNLLENWLHAYKEDYRGGDPVPHELGVDMSWDGETPLPYGIGANGVNENTATDQRVYDATFLKIKNITLTYNLPTSLVNKIKLRQARVYASVENLHTFTKYIGNPEVNSYNSSNPMIRGVDYSTYPVTKKYTIGLNITF